MPFARVAEQVRCIYCEKAGDRIVHPVKGGLAEFELYKSKANVYTNDKIIRGEKIVWRVWKMEKSTAATVFVMLKMCRSLLDGKT